MNMKEKIFLAIVTISAAINLYIFYASGRNSNPVTIHCTKYVHDTIYVRDTLYIGREKNMIQNGNHNTQINRFN